MIKLCGIAALFAAASAMLLASYALADVGETTETTEDAAKITVSVLLEPMWDFDLVYNFHEGMAAVMNRDASGIFPFGYVNKDGEIVIPLQFYADAVESCGYAPRPHFSEGLVSLYSHYHETMGFFDRYGYPVIPFTYRWARHFSQGLAAVGQGHWGYWRATTDGGYWVRENMQWGFIDREGSVVIPLEFSFARSFSEGLAAVRTGHHRGEGWGFIDMGGNIVVPLEFNYARYFTEGLAAVMLDRKWGFVNKYGDLVIPFNFDSTFCQSTGDWFVPYFSEGLAAVMTSEVGEFREFHRYYPLIYSWGAIDKYGNVVIPFTHCWMQSFSDGRAVVRDDNIRARGVIDRDGNKIVPFGRYNRINRFTNGMAAVSIGDTFQDTRYGFIDVYGNEVIPPTFSRVRNFSEGLAAVLCAETHKWGFIDTTGSIIVPFIYDDARDFTGGIAWVRRTVPEICDDGNRIYSSLWGVLKMDMH